MSALEASNRLFWRTGKKAEITQQYRWVNAIYYQDSQYQKHYLNVVECLETKPDKQGRQPKTKFKWITDLEVSKQRVVELAHKAGRMRWKIENEGFNVQKNGGYNLEHAYTTNYNSSKIFYYLLQMAHILFQLVEKGSLLNKQFAHKCGSGKNLAFLILEAWRNAIISSDLLVEITKRRMQVRFDTS